MPEPMTQPLDPYEPQTAYEWDDEEETVQEGPKVLWGRIAILALALIIAFLLGRAAAPNGIPASTVTDLEGKVAELEGDNEALRGEVAALQAAAEEANNQAAQEDPEATGETDTETDTEDETGSGTSTETVEIYVVKPGDSLTSISEEFYGTTEYGNYLAEVNGIADPTSIQVGQELTIPEEPE